MNITFLIGNGFDLNLGLNTKYSDFYDFYFDDIIRDSDIIRFKNNILKNKELWSDAELAFGKYTEQFKSPDGADTFCDCHEDFCRKLAIYLENEESKFLIDKNDIKTLTKEFAVSISNYYRFFREAPKNKIIESFNYFGYGFNYNFINFNYTRTLDKLVDMVNSAELLGTRKYGDRLYQNNVNQEVFHVHGFTNQDMVLGVDNENQIHNLDIFKDQSIWSKHQIIKQKSNEMNDRLVDESVYNLIMKTDLFYIYGMSLGETDTLWWKRIIERMVSHSFVRLIIHQYGAPNRDFMSMKYRKFEDEVKTKFLNYSSEIDDAIKNLLIGRIHIDSGNIFGGLQNIANQRVENFVALEQI